MWHQKCTIFANKFAFFSGIFALSKFVANLLFFRPACGFSFSPRGKTQEPFLVVVLSCFTSRIQNKNSSWHYTCINNYSKLTPLVSQAFG